MIEPTTNLLDLAIRLMVTGEDLELIHNERENAMDEETIEILLDDKISTGG